MQDQEWVPIEVAREFSGHCTNSALAEFVRRWNFRNPSLIIYRRPGFVEMSTLRAAIDQQAAQYTPGLAARNAASKSITKLRRPRANANAAIMMKGKKNERFEDIETV